MPEIQPFCKYLARSKKVEVLTIAQFGKLFYNVSLLMIFSDIFWFKNKQ